jgi:transposase-like protein
VRLEQDKLCLLVIVGVRADGSRELVALADGYRESTGSWADLLRDCARRGMRAPVLAVGDGALGFWAALREMFPDTREQRCWFHKSANVLSALPRSAHPGAKAALAEIWGAEDKTHAQLAARRFGNPIESTDSRGKTISYSYDALNRQPPQQGNPTGLIHPTCVSANTRLSHG